MTSLFLSFLPFVPIHDHDVAIWKGDAGGVGL
jgi:hypothetical protein